jgi:hypothetical protein
MLAFIRIATLTLLAAFVLSAKQIVSEYQCATTAKLECNTLLQLTVTAISSG